MVVAAPFVAGSCLPVSMALVDGEISTDEWKLLVKFAQRMGLALLDVRNIIRGIETGELVTS